MMMNVCSIYMYKPTDMFFYFLNCSNIFLYHLAKQNNNNIIYKIAFISLMELIIIHIITLIGEGLKQPH